MSWTAERTALAVKLWGLGKSASQVAADLGDVSRNAVIGKLHRLGLSGRGAPSTPKGPNWHQRRDAQRAEARKSGPPSRPATPRKGAQYEEGSSPAEVVALANAVVPLMLPLEGLGDGCKFPYGDGPFHFCGHDKPAGQSYCKAHHRLSFRPDDARKRPNADRFAKAVAKREKATEVWLGGLDAA